MLDTNLLKSIPFFENFPDDQLDIIVKFCEVQSFRAKEIILSQGDLNFDMHFLVEGTVGVFVDEKFVISMSNNGQVFGEMSIAGHTTCTATVATKVESTFVRFNYNDFQNLEIENKDSISKNIFQSIAEILAYKLILTNEIAKTFKEKVREISKT
jgi:signal-transduction protein with cAMP-binding, CBS, and nucleotidyltransferase domain